MKKSGKSSDPVMRPKVSIRGVIIASILIIMSLSGCQMTKNAEDDSANAQNDPSNVASQVENRIGTNQNTPLTLKQRMSDFNYLFDTIVNYYPYHQVNETKNQVDFESNYETYLSWVKQSESTEEFLVTLQKIMSNLNNAHAFIVEEDLKTGNLDDENSSNYIPNKVRISVKDIVEDKVGYINVPVLPGKGYIEKDRELICSYLNKISKYQALIIDLRSCPGGTIGYWSEFLLPLIIDSPIEDKHYLLFKESELLENTLKDESAPKLENVNSLTDSIEISEDMKKDYPYYYYKNIVVSPDSDTIAFKGTVYVLIDRYTYSAADALALFVKSLDQFVLIGEPTMGGGVDAPVCGMLPNSGFSFQIPLALGLESDGTIHEILNTVPDYHINYPKKNDNLNYDLCIIKILELEQISIDELASQ